MKTFLHKLILGTRETRGDGPALHRPAHYIVPRQRANTQAESASSNDTQSNSQQPNTEVKIIFRKTTSQKRNNSFLAYFAFPPELQLLVLSFLDFGDIERLRRSCKFFRIQISKPLIRSLFPELSSRLRKTCYLCLTQYASGAEVVSTDSSDARYPLSSRCVSCVIKKKGFMVGREYMMGNDVTVFVCRWCGYPVLSLPARNHPGFHRRCFKRYTNVVFLYYFFGLAQWVIMIIASALCWQYFKENVEVLAPTIVGFIVSLWSFCLSTVRGSWFRTYHFSLICESGILSTWIIATVAIFKELEKPDRNTGTSDEATLAFIAFNLVFRLFNVIGNLILLFEYKIWRHKRSNMSQLRQTWIRTIEVFIFFAEPQCVEQQYPGVWWFRKRQPNSEEFELADVVEDADAQEAGVDELVIGPNGDFVQPAMPTNTYQPA